MKIDFVVTWLDSSDPEWIKLYNQYRPGIHKEDKGRYRNWDFFRYWFRAVENFAPWVNNVFLITNGKTPEWINPDCPKLKLIKHSDYIPDKYLPTFNSRTIEFNMNRINDLSEHFVYFNDDCFVNGDISPEYYFRDGLPNDFNNETIFNGMRYTPQARFGTNISIACDIGVINYHFNRRDVIRGNLRKWYGSHLGVSGFLTSLLLYNRSRFEGFKSNHNEQAYLKSIFDEVWQKEYNMVDKTCTRFREDATLNPYFFRFWQLATNRFNPIKYRRCVFQLGVSNVAEICSSLENETIKSICLNDGPLCEYEDYLRVKEIIGNVFEKKFPQKSSFEI